MSIGRWAFVCAGMPLLAALGVLAGVTWIEKRQAGQLQAREPYVELAGAGPSSRAIVVYFSRSGNTALAARHIAHRLDARLLDLEAPAYRLGLAGLFRALRDARGSEASIQPRTVDLRAYDTVYLGSPVWLYSPAPPIWAFVDHNRIDGKHVVLFNTYNSHFSPEAIDALRVRVMRNGARSFDHRAVLRGRMTRQLPPERMIEVIDASWL